MASSPALHDVGGSLCRSFNSLRILLEAIKTGAITTDWWTDSRSKFSSLHRKKLSSIEKNNAPTNYPAKSPLVRRDPQAGAVDSPPSSPSFSPFLLFPLLLVLAVLFAPTTLLLLLLLLLQAPQISESPNPHKDSASLLLPSWSRSSLASFRFLFLSS